MTTRNMTPLLGLAIGDGLGHFLLKKPQLCDKLHRSLTHPSTPQISIDYGEHTQLALLFHHTFHSLEKPHHSSDFATQFHQTLTSFSAQNIRESHSIYPILNSNTPKTQESTSSCIILGSLGTCFNSIDKLVPWLLGYTQSFNRHPHSVAGALFLGMYLLHQKQGHSIDDFLNRFLQWRQSSQALQSPIPDQVYWAFQQALMIAHHYNRRHMLEFVGQDRSMTLTAPNADCVLSMVPYAISIAHTQSPLELMRLLSDPSLMISKSDLSILGMLCGLIIGNKAPPFPSSVTIRNFEALENPTLWSPHIEIGPYKQSISIPHTPKTKPQQLKLF